jgi:superfamily II DNA/RNA helicase
LILCNTRELAFQIKKEFDRFTGFDYIVNTVGIIRHKIDDSKVSQVENAIYVNGVFPRKLDYFGHAN